VRLDEEAAKEAFTRFLHQAGSSVVEWRSGHEPPDYFLDVEGHEFAVEVTQVMETIALQHAIVSARGVSEALSRFAQAIHDAATEAGILNGTYVIHLSPVYSLPQEGPSLQEAALSYIAQTRRETRADLQWLSQAVDGTRCAIEKISNTGALVAETVGVGPAKWGPDILDETRCLLHEAVCLKGAKLKNVQGKSILLLLDAYYYGTADDWRTAAGIVDPKPFHTIARITPNRECQVLYSQERAWVAAT
jgi:hypothetical protein